MVAVEGSVRCSGVQVSRSTALHELSQTRRQQVPTVSLEYALATSSATFSRQDFDEAIDAALRQRLTTWVRVERALDDLGRRGRKGSAQIRQVLRSRSIDPAAPLSSWNREFAGKLTRAGLPTPMMEWRIDDDSGELLAQVDLAYPNQRYVIELDSVAYHHNTLAFETDRKRDSNLLRQGWLVSRFTWNQYVKGWPDVVETIRAGLGR